MSRESRRSSERSPTRFEIRKALRGVITKDLTRDLTQEFMARLEPVIPPQGSHVTAGVHLTEHKPTTWLPG